MRFRFGTFAAGLAFTLLSSSALAQSWVGSRTTPALGEIVAIDATGEPGWIFGAEDLAGDGASEFRQQEQSIDIRTAYAATDSSRFWIRMYVSDPNAVGGNVTIYVFVDSDRSAATGGTAAAPEIQALLTTDPSPGGYEYVIEIDGNGSIGEIWEWNEGASEYQGTSPSAGQAEAEADRDLDPIEINESDHGYLQAMVDLDQVGLTAACDAMLFVRSVHTAGGGDGDLDVGQLGPCSPVDTNGDGVPDVLVDGAAQCTADDQCPGRGICVAGRCVIDDGTAGAGGANAGGGGPEGDLPFEEGVDEVRGGALTCAAGASRTAGRVAGLCFIALLCGAAWRRRRR